MATFTSAFDAIPPVTRTILLATAIVTGPCLLAINSPANVALSWFKVWQKYEIWRPFTAYFFGGGGFPLLYDVFLIFRNSSSLEKDVYFSNTANYAWAHVVIALCIMVLNIPFSIPFLFRSLLHAQTYLWCRANPTMKVSIFGLITIPTSLYPPALILLDVLTGGPAKALGGVLGLLAGHFWWFVSTYLPVHAPRHLRRPNPLSTPAFFTRLFTGNARSGFTTTQTTRAPGAGVPTPAASGSTTQRRSEAAEAVRHRWGGGNRLGGSAL